MDRAELMSALRERLGLGEASEPLTTTLPRRPGFEVLAKLYHGEPSAMTFSNRSQAQKRAEALGAGWAVYQWGRPFFVARAKEKGGEKVPEGEKKEAVVEDVKETAKQIIHAAPTYEDYLKKQTGRSYKLLKPLLFKDETVTAKFLTKKPPGGGSPMGFILDVEYDAGTDYYNTKTSFYSVAADYKFNVVTGKEIAGIDFEGMMDPLVTLGQVRGWAPKEAFAMKGVKEAVEELRGVLAEQEKWIAGAIKNKGALRKKLKAPEGEKIPAGKLKAAAKEPGKTGKQARLALTLRKLGDEAEPSGAVTEQEKKAKLGSGARFKGLVAQLKKRGDIKDPAALAAWIGRKKYGGKKFQKLATAGKK